MVEAASQLMFSATEGKVFFGDVVIVVPENWSCQGQTGPANDMVYSWDSAHLRVGPSHYLFGDNPWTQQLGGCGEPGDWIYVPDNFLLNNSNVGSPGEDAEPENCCCESRDHLFHEIIEYRLLYYLYLINVFKQGFCHEKSYIMDSETTGG